MAQTLAEPVFRRNVDQIVSKSPNRLRRRNDLMGILVLATALRDVPTSVNLQTGCDRSTRSAVGRKAT